MTQIHAEVSRPLRGVTSAGELLSTKTIVRPASSLVTVSIDGNTACGVFEALAGLRDPAQAQVSSSRHTLKNCMMHEA